MKKIFSVWFLLIMILTGLTACKSANLGESNSEESAGDMQSKQVEVIKVDSDEAKALIKEESAVLVDVRTQAEYDERHIEGSILIPLAELESLITEKIADKNTKIILYCRSGNRSAHAGKQLIDMGYTQVYDLGAINSWEE